MATVRIEVSDARRFLNRVRRAADPRVLLRLIGLRQLRFVDENFRAQGLERKWPPLSPNTLAKPGRGSGARILRDKSKLSQSFTTDQVGANAVRIGTNVEYADHHEFGARPYTIVPTRRQALRFHTVQGVRFSKRVRHPGLPVRKMLPSQAMAERLAVEVIEATVNRAL